MATQNKNGRIRVLYAIEDLEVGGAERLLVQTATHLDREHFDPAVCCLTRPGALAEEVESHNVPLVALGKKPGIDFSVALRLASLLRRERFDIIHTHLFTADLWGRMAGLLAGVGGLVSTEHSLAPWKDKKRIFIDRVLDRFTHRIIAVTAAVREHLLRQRVAAPDKITVIRNAVDPGNPVTPEERWRVRQELGISPIAPVLGSLGRLAPEKGPEVFLKAAQIVAAQHPDARFLIVGGGSCYAQMEALAQQLGIQDKVIFTGVRTDVRTLLGAMDLFVLPSHTEGMSIALLEAMAASLPVVATAVGGTPDVISHEDNGWLVQPDNPKQMALACGRLIRDEPLRTRLAVAGRQRVVQQFGLETMIERTQSVYRSVLAN